MQSDLLRADQNDEVSHRAMTRFVLIHRGRRYLSLSYSVFFLRRFAEPKRSPKIVQRFLKICFYNNVNKAKYAQEQLEKKLAVFENCLEVPQAKP